MTDKRSKGKSESKIRKSQPKLKASSCQELQESTGGDCEVVGSYTTASVQEIYSSQHEIQQQNVVVVVDVNNIVIMVILLYCVAWNSIVYATGECADCPIK